MAICSWFPLMHSTCGCVRNKATRSAEAGHGRSCRPNRSAVLRFELQPMQQGRNVARWPWTSPTTNTRCPSSIRACNSAQAKGPQRRSKREVQLATQAVHQEMFPSVNRCLNPYVFPHQLGDKACFATFSPFLRVQHQAASSSPPSDESASSSASSMAAAVASESLSVEALPAPIMPMAIIAIPPTQNKRVTQSIHESKFVQ